MQANPELFLKYLVALLRYDTTPSPEFCWQGFSDKPDDKRPYNKPEFVTFTELTSAHLTKLKLANESGFTVSVGINQFLDASKGRKKTNVARVRALVVDIDQYVPVEILEIIQERYSPTLLVVTSKKPGERSYKAHIYWGFSDTSEKFVAWCIKHFKTLQLVLAAKLDFLLNAMLQTSGVEYTDKSITIEKALRAPGFLHKKDAANPSLVQLMYEPNPTAYLSQDGLDGLFDKLGITKQDLLDAKNRVVKTTEAPVVGIATTYTGKTEGEGRHNALFAYCKRLFMDNKCSYEEAATLLETANLRNDPPLLQDEVEGILNSCFAYYTSRLSPKLKAAVEKTGTAAPEIAKFVQKAKTNAAEAAQIIAEAPELYAPEFEYDYSNPSHFADFLSDKSILYRLLQRFPGKIVASPAIPAKVYDSKLGIFRDDAGDLDALLSEVIVGLAKEPMVLNNFVDRKGGLDDRALGQYIRGLRCHPKLMSLISYLPMMREFHVHANEFEKEPNLLNTPHGVVNLDTGELTHHSYKYRMLNVTRGCYAPDGYERYMNLENRADWEGSSPWTRFVYEIMDGDIEMCRFLQTAFGYALRGSLEAQCLFFFYGAGNNGKSLCLETFVHMLGTYAAHTTNEMFLERVTASDSLYRAELAGLVGKRMILAKEINRGQRLNEANIKDITTGTEITGRFMRNNPFSFAPRFTSFLHGNHKPLIAGTDLGIWRRIVTIPFFVNFEDRKDPFLKDKLTTPEVMNHMLEWAVAGHIMYKTVGLQPPVKVRAAKLEYRDEMHPMEKALRECFTKQDNAYTPLADLYECYKLWCDYTCVEYDTKIKLGNMLRMKGYEPQNIKGVQHFKVVLTPTWADALKEAKSNPNYSRGKLLNLVTGGK